MEKEVARQGQTEDARRVKKVLDPKKPTDAEVEEHRLTHIP